MTSARRIVVLGMLTKIPVAGVVWQTLHYLLGLRELGFDPWYVEAHARTPSMLMRSQRDDGGALAAGFIDRAMRRFDLGDRWAYQALHADGRCYGLSERELLAVYDSAELIINLHGGTAPRPEHADRGRLVYLETDPVALQIELAEGVPETVEFLERHCAFFTFGELWGTPGCALEPTARFAFHPTRQPVCLGLWPVSERTPEPRFTTIANWRQEWRDVTVDGHVYSWSKHREFERFLDVPARTGERFELALSNCPDADRQLLSQRGWTVTDAMAQSWDIDRYRSFISGSVGEFTAAKEQNVALRSGWFSDRSATYLAAGRPVVTQDTGFSEVLPTGCGLHAFSTLDEACGAVESVCGNYERARRDAREIARAHFASDVVLRELLAIAGVTLPGWPAPARALAGDLCLEPLSRRPLRLAPGTLETLRRAPMPAGPGAREAEPPVASVVVVSYDDVALTRMCAESVLENTDAPSYELIVIDNGSTDGSRAYLLTLARRFPNVHVRLCDANLGFPAAANLGLAQAQGELLVLLNNDTLVAPGWLAALARHASAPGVGLAGPVTNRIGNEAEVAVGYKTYGEFIAEAAERAKRCRGEAVEVAMPAMFCVAMRREVHERLGPLDEAFGLGTLEDDDYAERAARAGYRCVCAQDVLVHHFGEGSFGRLYADGSHGALIEGNRRRFEDKWGRPWVPYARRLDQAYLALRERVHQVVAAHVPSQTAVIVASRGDDDLLRFPAHRGWHFPQEPGGVYAGRYPACDDDAIGQLEELRGLGGEFFLLPATSLWWLERYPRLREHLDARYREIVRDDACVVYSLGAEGQR